MTQEIIYTSAPKGLRAGVKGFCTVASTAGMSQPMADRLESLSGYRHLFPPFDSRAHENPVNYSHLKLTVGGMEFSVLSRIADAGFDYSQRSNKLAHHVALAATERVSGGPAAVLAAPGFMETSWSGEPRILPAGRKPPSVDAPPRICTHWQQQAGDAGWAGVLAEGALQSPPRTVYVIYRLKTDVLSLVVEALALVPTARRWDVTFSTFFSKLPPGIDCMWRFVADGDAEAQTARRSPHWTVIDLCKQLPQAVGGNLVEQARTGKLPAAASLPTATARLNIPDRVELPDLPPPDALDPLLPPPDLPSAAPTRAARTPVLPASPPTHLAPAMPPSAPPQTSVRLAPEPASLGLRDRNRPSVLPQVAKWAAVVLIAAGFATLTYFYGREQGSSEQAALDSKSNHIVAPTIIAADPKVEEKKSAGHPQASRPPVDDDVLPKPDGTSNGLDDKPSVNQDKKAPRTNQPEEKAPKKSSESNEKTAPPKTDAAKQTNSQLEQDNKEIEAFMQSMRELREANGGLEVRKYDFTPGASRQAHKVPKGIEVSLVDVKGKVIPDIRFVERSNRYELIEGSEKNLASLVTHKTKPILEVAQGRQDSDVLGKGLWLRFENKHKFVDIPVGKLDAKEFELLLSNDIQNELNKHVPNHSKQAVPPKLKITNVSVDPPLQYQGTQLLPIYISRDSPGVVSVIGPTSSVPIEPTEPGKQDHVSVYARQDFQITCSGDSNPIKVEITTTFDPEVKGKSIHTLVLLGFTPHDVTKHFSTINTEYMREHIRKLVLDCWQDFLAVRKQKPGRIHCVFYPGEAFRTPNEEEAVQKIFAETNLQSK